MDRNTTNAWGCSLSSDRQIEKNENLENRPLMLLNLQPDIFDPQLEDMVKRAYEIMGRKIGYEWNSGREDG